MPQTVILSNLQADAGGTVCDYTIRLRHAVTNVAGVTLLQYYIRSAPGVNSRCNAFKVGSITVTLGTASYTTATGLASAVNTAMTAAGVTGFTASIDSVTGTLKLTNSGASAVTVDFSISNSVGEVLGFGSSSQSIAASGSWIAQRVMATTTEVPYAVTLTGLGEAIYGSETAPSCTFVCPPDGEPTACVAQEHRLALQDLYSVTVSIRDLQGKAVTDAGRSYFVVRFDGPC